MDMDIPVNTEEQSYPWSRRPGAIIAAYLLLGFAILLAGYAYRLSAHMDHPYAANDLLYNNLPDMRINVNNADAATLQLLPSIGPALAGRIIADRELNGFYKDTTDLQRVKGIGPKTVEKLAGYMVFTVINNSDK